MIATSVAYQEAIRKSHQVAVVVEVLAAGIPISTLTAAVTGGSVTRDARAASRGRLDLSLVDDGTLGLVPSVAQDLLAPYGNELRISRGLVLPDGTVEAPTIGVFRIESVTVTDTAIAVTGMDRSARVITARFEEPYEVPAGTNVEAAILSAVSIAIPDVVTSFPGSMFTTPLLRAAEGDDRWAFVQSIATACGLDLYFNGSGLLTLAPLPSGDPVATFAEGEESVLLEAARDWRREGTFNRMIVTGENTGTAVPARGVWTDLDPSSATYYHGAFGHAPTFFVSQFITSDAQATDAAAALGVKQLGTTQTVSFVTVVDASLEPGDTVRMTRLRTGIDEDHVIDSITVPLTADQAMSGSTRARQVTS